MADPAVFATGLRNPWRCGFDSLTGDLWIGDVGDSYAEEINIIPSGTSGQHFGWPYFEGDLVREDNPPPNDYIAPLRQFRGLGVIIGGFVYRGAAIPELYGAYVFADLQGPAFNVSDVYALFQEPDGFRLESLTRALTVQRTGPLYGFNKTRDGEILMCFDRGIFQIVPDNCLRRVGALLAHYGADDASDPEFPHDLDDNEDGQINLADLAAVLATAPCGEA